MDSDLFEIAHSVKHSGMSYLDTIAAIATAPGEGGVAIIRVSGPDALAVADAVFRCPPPLPSQRRGGTFVFGRVVDVNGAPIDEALLLLMRAPRSYTREDTVEIQCHGGPVVARNILQRVLGVGARAAEPGEFTKRAFLNGRIDLAQAEAVADLIRARSDRAAAAAIQQLAGSLSNEIVIIYESLIEASANVEATLDFSDQEIPPDVLDPVQGKLRATIAALRDLLGSWNEGHLLRDGATVVIAGKPNVGKSTLLNALLGRDRAIVSHVPGTTRDTIEESLVLDGYPIRLVDTAGIRETNCAVEQEGIRRANSELASADVCLYVVDASVGPDDEDRRFMACVQESKLIVVLNKVDLAGAPNKDISTICSLSTVYTSSKIGIGLSELRDAIVRKLSGGLTHSAHHALISTRHRALIEEALQSTLAAAERLEQERGALDIAALQLRDATEAVGRIIGKSYHDELLDSIFGKFCIGK